MVRFILENLDQPLKNAEIAAVTCLHENYAIALFSRIMRIPPRQFMVRMRLMRARALLVESSMAIPSVAEASGFSSMSQFYHRFREAYGVTPARDARPLRAPGTVSRVQHQSLSLSAMIARTASG